MIKPPIPSNEKERLAALDSYNIMDSLPEIDYDNITKIASEICQMPVALITFMGEDRQWFKSKIGVDLTENQRDFTFCGHGMEQPGIPLVVNDATKDPRFVGNPLVAGDYHVRFYAGVQLVSQEGFPLGTLCVFDVENNTLTESQLEALQILANQVVRLLDLRKTLSHLENTQKGLLRSINHLQEFDYIVSHDLKAPLRNMKHLAEAVSEDYEDKLDELGKAYLKQMNETASDAIFFVDGLLDYSRAMHYVDKKQENVDLNELLRIVIQQANIPTHIKIIIPDFLPTVNASRIALQQVFSNLISNAAKYNDKEEGWIRIIYSDNKDKYVFKVEDNGQGISKEKLENIFSLFYMVNKKEARKYGSSGIGLSIVKKRVADLGGEVVVNSVLNEGSVFEFFIPK